MTAYRPLHSPILEVSHLLDFLAHVSRVSQSIMSFQLSERLSSTSSHCTAALRRTRVKMACCCSRHFVWVDLCGEIEADGLSPWAQLTMSQRHEQSDPRTSAMRATN